MFSYSRVEALFITFTCTLELELALYTFTQNLKLDYITTLLRVDSQEYW